MWYLRLMTSTTSLLRVALVGAPNAGKSTLFNRLVGRRKALVHSQPGMTRDINEEVCLLDGRRVELVDTGGLFAPGDSIFADLVRNRVLKEASRAALLIFMVDGRTGLTSQDQTLAQLFRQTGRPVVVAVNKLDVPGRDDQLTEFHEMGFASVVALSAEHALGLDELHEAVGALLPAEQGEPDAAAMVQTSEPGVVRIAIAGRPNVGKSSLLNALVGEDRSMVSEIAGTTRDAVDSRFIRGGTSYIIVDTAGLRRKGRVVEAPEALSVMTARRSIERADVVLLIMDATDAPTLQDLHVAGVADEHTRPLIVLLNKWDLVRNDEGAGDRLMAEVRARLKFAPFAPLLSISALHGARVDRILPLVDEVHEQACRKLPTGRLNNWLKKAIDKHHAPSVAGKELKFFYVTQRRTNPPAFAVFTNSARTPHFSYQRYLENSLREHFGLTHTPVILEYRERPRRAKLSTTPPKKTRRRPV